VAEHITITVLRIKGRAVRLGIQAPSNIIVRRVDGCKRPGATTTVKRPS
jgi:sRNA-binding carbon storage regulator CsrA